MGRRKTKRADSKRAKQAVKAEYDNNAADYLSWATGISFQTEVDRGSSLERLAVNLLSSVSIASVALLTLAPMLFQRYSGDIDGWTRLCHSLLAVGYTVVLTLLGVTFLLALLSQVRLKQTVFDAPMAQSDYVDGEIRRGAPFCSRLDVEKQKARALQSHFDSLFKKNEFVRKMLKAAMIVLVVALGIIFFLIVVIGLCELLSKGL